MINLLPLDVKQHYKFARRNVTLRRWVAACLLAFVGLGAIATFGLLSFQQSTNSLNRQIASSNKLFQQENLSATQTQIKVTSTTFKSAVKVLSQEVLFSKLLQQIGTIVPASVNLTSLTLNQALTSVDISAVATNYAAASQLQTNLASPGNTIFSRADIENIACSSAAADDPTHPCTVTIRALFVANSPYLLLNNTAARP